jgi:type IV secretory pathway VirB10-like protein
MTRPDIGGNRTGTSVHLVLHGKGGMGLDSRSNAGLRDQMGHQYRRLIGFSVLTSLFTAAFEISQRTNQTTPTYSTPERTAGSAFGQELSQTGAQMTRFNLNVQPTTKVPVGYKFTVRVTRDLPFEAPYEPVSSSVAARQGFQTKLPNAGASW